MTDSPAAGLYGSTVGANMLRAAVAEFIGTGILVLTGTAVVVGAVLSHPTAGGSYDSLAVALAFGLVLVALVSALGHVSGAHLNPAVTLALAGTRNFPWRYVPTYLAAQLGGGIARGLGTWMVFGAPGRARAHLGATYPASGVGDLRAVAVETLITFVLTFVIMAVATDERVSNTAAASTAVGLALAAGVFIGGPVSGGAVNPARALGPMLATGDLHGWWIYIVGPVLGATVAAVIYDRFLRAAQAPPPVS